MDKGSNNTFISSAFWIFLLSLIPFYSHSNPNLEDQYYSVKIIVEGTGKTFKLINGKKIQLESDLTQSSNGSLVLRIKKNQIIKILTVPSDGWGNPSLKVLNGNLYPNVNGRIVTLFPKSMESTLLIKYSPKRVRINIQVDSGGVALLNNQNKIIYGEPVKISAISNPEWDFIQWEIISGFGKVENPKHQETRLIPWGNTTVRAVFSKNIISVTINQKGKGKTNIDGETSAIPGKPISLKAYPENGWAFSQWEIIKGHPVIANQTSPNTSITLIQSGSVQAVFLPTSTNFSEVKEFSKDVVMLLKSKKGGEVISSAGTKFIPANTEITISATAHENYRFKYWKLSGSGGVVEDPTNQTTNIQVKEKGKATFTAIFEPLPDYQIAEFEEE